MEDGDKDAEARVIDFMQKAFAPKFDIDIDTGNVATLNPTRQRPDMYVDQRKYAAPLYDALHSGTLSDITPFVFPSSAAHPVLSLRMLGASSQHRAR